MPAVIDAKSKKRKNDVIGRNTFYGKLEKLQKQVERLSEAKQVSNRYNMPSISPRETGHKNRTSNRYNVPNVSPWETGYKDETSNRYNGPNTSPQCKKQVINIKLVVGQT